MNAGLAASGERRWLFVLTIFGGSFLLFLVQPMVARMALPRLGGAPNVWNSAMLVYQALLLAGYAYAHALSRWPVRRQAAIHLVVLVLAGLTLPISLPALASPRAGLEALWVPWLFLLTVGPVFFAVSAQAPLMQRWFAAAPAAGDPYPLYAASNLGSFAGLIAYPFLAEPLFPLGRQSGAWALGYAALVLLVAATAFTRREAPASCAASSATETNPSWRRIALWIALAAVPSGLMLSTTTYLTTDIFAMPLLWVIPLGLYLLSFSIAFAGRRAAAGVLVLLAPLVLATDGALAMLTSEGGGLFALAASLVLLFVVAVALHSRLYEIRPEPARLTQFYLAMAAGGALGGLFTALVAPLVFDWTWEHPTLLLAAAALVPLGTWSRVLERRFKSEWTVRAVLAALLVAVLAGSMWLRSEFELDETWGPTEIIAFMAIAMLATLLAHRRWAYLTACLLLLATLGGAAQMQRTLAGERSRSYFGIYTVEDSGAGERFLYHGTTIHGMQRSDPTYGLRPTTYYGRTSGVGRTMLATERLFGGHARVGVLGLGVGTIACYSLPGQRWTFFEIDPVVRSFSQNGTFTYLRGCAPTARVVIGDARLNLAQVPPGSFDILVVDAFSSDAIPLHLTTEEAHKVYWRALAPDGLLLVHISNRFVDLEPPLAALAREQGLAAVLRDDSSATGGLIPSTWVVLSRDPKRLATLTGADKSAWRSLGPPAKTVWRDDFASILPYLTWRSFF